MTRPISLVGRGVVPCPHNVGEAHEYHGAPVSPAEALQLLMRAVGRHAQLGVAIDNLRHILIEEQVLSEDPREVPHALLEEVRQVLALAQSLIPGAHREVLLRIIRAQERLDAFEQHSPVRGQA